MSDAVIRPAGDSALLVEFENEISLEVNSRVRALKFSLEKNPFEGKRVRFVPDENDPVNADGVRGHLEEIPGTQAVRSASFYERFVKRGMDLILSFAAMIVLSPLLLFFCAAIFIDDPGPIFFTQKRLKRWLTIL